MPQNVALQRKFFDRYLKGIDNGWEQEPRVTVEVRSTDDGIARTVSATQYPLEGTRVDKLYLDVAAKTLSGVRTAQSASASYAAMSAGVTFSTAPLARDLVFAGPLKAHLYMASSLPHMDLFVTVRAYGPDGKEATFFASDEPAFPVSMGWLRGTHRKLGAGRSSD